MEEIYAPPANLQKPMETVDKFLMGPGPSNSPKRVLDAMSRQLMGHLHPETCKIMDEIKDGIRYVFQTNNVVTLCTSASGHGGMETALCNLIEDDDVVLIGVNGLWGHRATDMAERYGAHVRHINVSKMGRGFTLTEIEEGLRKNKPKLLFLTQGESSAGVLQPLEGVGDLCRAYDCLLVVDTVASLGGTPFYADKWKVDVVYTGSQKVIGAPPGITPISFSERAMKAVQNRKTKSRVYYWDINLLADYWNCFGRPRIYHHTISATLIYGLREALAMACAEGMNNIVKRHHDCFERLKKGLAKLGLELYVEEPQYRLPTVTSIKVPEGIDYRAVSEFAMKNYLVEVSGGLGPTAGQIFRIGLMGVNATNERVDLVLDVMEKALNAAREKK